MRHNSHLFYKFLYRTLNLITLPIALFTAMSSRFKTFTTPFDESFRFLLLYGFVSWVIVTYISRYYENSWHSKSSKTLFNTSKVSILFLAFIGLISFFLKEVAYSRIIILLFSVYQFILVLITHHIIQYYLTKQDSFFKKKNNILIVGSEESSKDIILEVKNHPQWVSHIIGYINSTKSENSKLKYLGKLDNLEEIISENSIQEILITLSIENNNNDIMQILNITEQNGIRSQIVPQNINNFNVPIKIAYFGSVITYRIRHIPLDSLYNKFMKRSFDIVASACGILILSPLIILVYILLKLADKGPLFFKQERTGYNQASFYCYKFRSMYVTPPKVSDGKQALKNDPRLLKIGNVNLGNLLRKSNIDELPQLLNVLKGDMSLVGPRPHMLTDTEEFKSRVDIYMVRHFVRPGITGLAQSNGFRGPTDTKEKLEGRVHYDLKYVENWTFGLDIKIILQTIFTKKSKEH